MSLRLLAARLARRLALATLALASGLAAAAGPKAYVGNFKDSTVSVVDTEAGAVLKTVPVATGPHGMAVSADGRWVFVTGDGSSSMSVIDTASDTVARTVEVGASPHGVALLPDGKTILVGVYGADRVAFVDIASGAVVATVPVASRTPSRSGLTASFSAGVASQELASSPGVVVVDLAARSVARRIELDKPPRDPEFSYDGKYLYVTVAGVNALRVIDAATEKQVAEIATGPSPHLGKWFAGAAVGTIVVQVWASCSRSTRRAVHRCAASRSASSRTGWPPTARPWVTTKARTTSPRSIR